VRQRGHRPCRRRQVGGGEQHGQPILEPAPLRYSPSLSAVRRGRKRLTVMPFGDRYVTTWIADTLQTTHHHLSDSAVVLREKLMHGLPVRVVAVTNVDLKIMVRRTPTDSVLGRRSSRQLGSEDASGYCRTGFASAATTAGAEIRRRRRSCCRGDWVLRSVVEATNDWRKIVGRRTMIPRVPAPTMGEQQLQPRKDLHVIAEQTSSTCG
jgi:hypothetical protein